MTVFQLLLVVKGAGQSMAVEKVTLGLQDESLETAIKRIEEQSALRFFYRSEDISPLVHLNLKTDTRTIAQTLDVLLQNTYLSFRQVDGHILLEREEHQEISGRIVDSTNKKPIANASVFLNNTTTGAITDNDGVFKLTIARTGKYEIVVSMMGYAPYQKPLFADGSNITLPDIKIVPQVISLSEVKVKIDPRRDRDYKWFKEDFLGSSNFADKCRIINPEILDLNYNKKTKVLRASSSRLLEVENDALGYKLSYLLTHFYSNKNDGRVSFKGLVLFEQLTGDPAQQQKWEKNRMKAYKGSSMHFLRSLLENQLDEEGFEVLVLKKKAFPNYPNRYFDSLGVTPLHVNDMVKLSDKKDIYALNFKSQLYVMYTRLHNYKGNLESIPFGAQPGYAKTTVTFIAPYTFFDNSGIIINPGKHNFDDGYWSESRVAELLPSDYEPGAN